jgi:hypothetical protein
MRFREFLLLLLIIGAGFAVYQYQTGGWDFHWGLDDELFFSGRAFDYEETLALEAPVPAEVEIDNSHGWVEVRGEDRPDAVLTFKKRVWRRSEEEARELADRLRVVRKESAGRLVLSTNRDEFKKRNFETAFILTLPRTARVTVRNSYGAVKAEAVAGLVVENRHGEVLIADIPGAWDIETSYEDIEGRRLGAGGRAVNRHADIGLFDVQGDVETECRYGTVKLDGVRGKAVVRAEHARLDLRNIKGEVEAESSYEDILIEGTGAARVRARHSAVKAGPVAGDLRVETSYEPVQATDVSGSLIVEAANSEVFADGVGGPEVSVSTSHENVRLTDFAGRAAVSLRHGDLILKPRRVDSPIRVDAEYCNVEFEMPPGASRPLEARSRGGNIVWSLGEKPDLEQSNGTSLLRAFGAAAEPFIYISTSYGDIRISPGVTRF